MAAPDVPHFKGIFSQALLGGKTNASFIPHMLNISTPFQLKRLWIWTNCNMNYTGTANAGKMTNFGVHFGFASPTLASQAGNTKRVHNFRGTLCKKSQQQWAVEDSEKCSNIRFPADHHIFTFHTNFQVHLFHYCTLRWLKHLQNHP